MLATGHIHKRLEQSGFHKTPIRLPSEQFTHQLQPLDFKLLDTCRSLKASTINYLTVAHFACWYWSPRKGDAGFLICSRKTIERNVRWSFFSRFCYFLQLKLSTKAVPTQATQERVPCSSSIPSLENRSSKWTKMVKSQNTILENETRCLGEFVEQISH